MYADVFVDNVVLEKTESLLYKIPSVLEKIVGVGQLVTVPFGRISKKGIIINLINNIPAQKFRIREVVKVYPEEVLISKENLEVAKKISIYYSTPLYKCIKLFLPSGLLIGALKTKTETFYRVVDKKVVLGERAKKQRDLFLDFLNKGDVDLSANEVSELPGYSASALTALIDKGVVEKKIKDIITDPLSGYETEKKDLPTLSAEQEGVFQEIIKNEQKIHLIRGITGSGKTEIYISLVKKALDNGQSSIILIPEINLTPQNIKRFLSFFPKEIAVWHSRLTDSEKFYELQKIKNGEAKVIIGSRSALFMPVRNLGLIVVDEEHDSSYKQESSPRYHARKVASMMVSENKNAFLVLGSATPSIESYYFAQKGVIKLHEIKSRYSLTNDLKLPEVKVIDLVREKRTYGSPIAGTLYLAISRCLEEKKQIILFLNKRGYHKHIQCFDCGNTILCNRCDIAYTVHREGDNYMLHCHYCGKRERIPATCPTCHGPMMRGLGYGTQTVEENIKELFPEAKVVRVDRDSTKKSGAHKLIYDDFFHKRIDILIGTQMIAKGLDIPNVGLVGVIMADIGLHMPDFRAHERVFQLLTQVAGRTGRRDNRGNVVIQTYSPENPAIMFAKNHDFEGFYEYEIKEREKYFYPPFSRIIKFKISDPVEVKAKEEAIRFFGILREAFPKLEMLGPSPDIFAKIYNKYYYQIILKLGLKDNISEIVQIAPKGWQTDSDL